MKTVVIVLAALPIALWVLGGFRMGELFREFPKLVAWYVVVGGLYWAFV
jgi:hypothetical protein